MIIIKKRRILNEKVETKNSIMLFYKYSDIPKEECMLLECIYKKEEKGEK